MAKEIKVGIPSMDNSSSSESYTVIRAVLFPGSGAVMIPVGSKVRRALRWHSSCEKGGMVEQSVVRGDLIPVRWGGVVRFVLFSYLEKIS